MSLVDLTVARAHCRTDEDDDDVLAIYLAAAQRKVCDELNRGVYETEQELDSAVSGVTAGRDPIVVNDAIRAAILLVTGHLYANREDVVGGQMTSLPFGARELLAPYILPSDNECKPET